MISEQPSDAVLGLEASSAPTLSTTPDPLSRQPTRQWGVWETELLLSKIADMRAATAADLVFKRGAWVKIEVHLKSKGCRKDWKACKNKHYSLKQKWTLWEEYLQSKSGWGEDGDLHAPVNTPEVEAQYFASYPQFKAFRVVVNPGGEKSGGLPMRDLMEKAFGSRQASGTYAGDIDTALAAAAAATDDDSIDPQRCQIQNSIEGSLTSSSISSTSSPSWSPTPGRAREKQAQPLKHSLHARVVATASKRAAEAQQEPHAFGHARKKPTYLVLAAAMEQEASRIHRLADDIIAQAQGRPPMTLFDCICREMDQNEVLGRLDAKKQMQLLSSLDTREKQSKFYYSAKMRMLMVKEILGTAEIESLEGTECTPRDRRD